MAESYGVGKQIVEKLLDFRILLLEGGISNRHNVLDISDQILWNIVPDGEIQCMGAIHFSHINSYCPVLDIIQMFKGICVILDDIQNHFLSFLIRSV